MLQNTYTNTFKYTNKLCKKVITQRKKMINLSATLHFAIVARHLIISSNE